jgi:uncharacterized protein (TIGR04255 family)
VVRRGTPLPTKLKNDAILEALLELRFESSTFPEVFLGRLVDHKYWKQFKQRRLPAYEIPAQMRQMEATLQHAPIIELFGADSKAALRIGPSVISYHRTSPYIGWQKFKPELLQVAESLFQTAENLRVNRMGLRYLNSLTGERHYIGSIADLDLRLRIADEDITKSTNINFITSSGDNSSCTVRIATKEFVQGSIPQDTSVFIDVDVFTNDGFVTSDQLAVQKWIEFAHAYEKTEFFRLFTQEILDKLKES